MSKVLRLIVCLCFLLLVVPTFAQEGTTMPQTGANTTQQGTATPQADSETQEDTETSDEPMAFFRFANFAPDMSVDFSMDEQPTETSALEYKAFSEWTAIPAGTYNLSVMSSADAGTVSEPMPVDFATGGWYTIAAIAMEDGSLSTEVIDETFAELLPGTSWTTFVNAIQGSTNVDFVRNESTYAAAMSPLGNAENQQSWFGILDDMDIFNFRVVESGNPDNVLVDAPDTNLLENEIYLIAAVGTADPDDEHNIEFLVENTSMAEVLMTQGVMEEPGTIIEAARANPLLTPWLEMVEQAGLTETLSGDGPFTVFVPADFVFDGLSDELRNNPEALATFLNNHIVEGDLRSQDVFKAGTLTTLGESDLTIEERGENAFVNEAQVIDVNIPATNGVIHIVNNFVVPTEVSTS